MRRFLTLSVLSILLILAVAYGLAFHYGPKIVYYGAYFGNTKECPEAITRAGKLEEISFTAADGTVLRGWFRNKGRKAPLVVVYGGNNINVGAFADLMPLAPQSSFLLLNHRGYGMSEGQPSESAIVKDACAVLQHMRQQWGELPHTTLLGFSLGTGVATQVAAREKVNQLILACPFDSVIATACQHVPLLPEYIPLDHFRSDLAAPNVRCPVTIFMGVMDDIVPPGRTLQLLPCFSSTRVQLHKIGSGHNDIFTHAEVRQELSRLLNVNGSLHPGASRSL